MKWFKLSLLLLLTLGVMRLCSWSLKWLLTKLLPHHKKLAAVLANGACFIAFVSWLYFDLLPGEPIDIAAVLFGLLVFGLFGIWDARMN
jgi:MFS superfamily sulfate permease-like transporter